MKSPVQSVEVTYFVNATEDGGKIAGAVSSLLGVTGRPTEEVLEGHFGNKIGLVEHHVTGEDALKVFENLAAGLEPAAMKEVLDSLEDFVDEHSSLHLRLDKQGLVQGRLVLSASDSVKVKVKPRLFSLGGGVLEFYRTKIGA